MTVHCGGEQGYGLFLNEEEAAAFEHAYATTHFLYEDGVCDEIGASVLCDENYDLRQIWHLDKKPHKEDGEDFVNGIFLYAEKQSNIILNSPDDAYRDLSEMADEFRKTYGNYLSDDFDYTAHLCYLLGASFRQLREKN